MDAGRHLAGLILDEPEIRSVLPVIRDYYNTFFSIHEIHLASRLLASKDPWETLKSFPLYPRYQALAENQITLAGISSDNRLAFIGCGPVPSSLILLNRMAGVRSVGLDTSENVDSLSRQVILRL